MFEIKRIIQWIISPILYLPLKDQSGSFCYLYCILGLLNCYVYSSLLLYVILLSIRLKEGLQTLGVYTAMGDNPDAFLKVLCTQPITLISKYLRDKFAPSFSRSGTDGRRKEEQLLAYWCDFLDETEG